MTSSSRKSVEEILAERGGIRLDIGGGDNPVSRSWVNMDKRDLPGVDVVWNWNDIPWPFPDESVIMAAAAHVIEHVNPVDGFFLRWMDEVWRIMKPDGEFAIATPHGYSVGYLQDPTHCNPCSEATFAYFDPLEPNTKGYFYSIYKPKPWKIKSLTWSPNANIECVLVKRLEDRSYYE